MQGKVVDQVLVYPKQYAAHVKQYSQRLPLPVWKQLDAKHIQSQFGVLEQGYVGDGKHVHNAHPHKDRYSDIKTFSHNRVMLDHIQDYYLNASVMRSVVDQEPYAIFAQAPVKNSLGHFWEACYHLNIKTIVMLCAFIDPKRGKQAEPYLPPKGQTVESDGIAVSCESVEDVSEEFTKSTIKMAGKEGVRELQHIHWSGWGDMRKPLGPNSEKLFSELVEVCLGHTSRKELFLVHCSAGAVIQGMRCARVCKALSVFEILDNMRRYRMGSVQREEQYLFIYETLRRLL